MNFYHCEATSEYVLVSFKFWSWLGLRSLESGMQGQQTTLANSTNKPAIVMAYFWWYLVYFLEGTLIFIANIVTTVIFWRRRLTLKRAAYLLINLAIADILVGVGVMSLGAIGISLRTLYWGEPESDILIPFVFLATSSSVSSLAVIAIERGFAITKPMKHRTAPTSFYWGGVVLAWVTASLVSTLMVIRPFSPEPQQKALLYIVASVFSFLLLVICISYFIIWWAIWKRSTGLGQRDLQHRKLAKTLFIVTFFSLATVIPGSVATLLARDGNDESVGRLLALMVVEFSNSLLNPFVYTLRMPEFRQELKRLCCRLSCHRNREGVIPMSDAGAGAAVTLRSVGNLARPASSPHMGICIGAATNNISTCDL